MLIAAVLALYAHRGEHDPNIISFEQLAYSKDDWHFDHYEPSEFESLWVDNIATWKEDICEHLMEESQKGKLQVPCFARLRLS